MLCQSVCIFSLLKQSSLSLTKSIPSSVIVHTVTFYHPPNWGSKETAQQSSSRLQGHSTTEAWAAYFWRPHAVSRHEEHCVHAQMIVRYTFCTKRSLTQTFSHGKYEVHSVSILQLFRQLTAGDNATATGLIVFHKTYKRKELAARS